MTDDVNQMTFERAIAELDALIEKLEGGQIDLADAVSAYQQGMRLASHCASLLDRTEATITQLVVGLAGAAVEAPFSAGAEAPAPHAAKPASGDPGLFPGIVPTGGGDTPVDPDSVPF